MAKSAKKHESPWLPINSLEILIHPQFRGSLGGTP